MTDSAPTTPAPAARFLPVLGGVSLFLVHQFAVAVWNLTHRADAMDNKFSKIAKEDFMGFLVGQNALMLIAYVILAVAGAFLLQPFVSWITGKIRFHRWWITMGIAWGLARLTNSFFIARMVESRPYFLPDAGGNWFSFATQALPANLHSGVSFAVFSIFPLVVLGIALFWQIRR
ncbi:MAG TPA: hypothetical protein VM511_07280, partial [Luteolibacter sp.]|nr:hypothetical protein [Luteolibacter sp.]